MKRLISLSLAAAMMLAMLASCGSDSDTSADTSADGSADTSSSADSAVSSDSIPSSESEPDGIVAGTSAILAVDADYISLQLPGQFAGGLATYSLVYDTLFWSPSGDMTDVTGLLVESWTVSEDNCTWVWEIREGIDFMNGNPLNAESVVGSMSFRLNELGGTVVDNLLDYEATGEYQVTVTLSAPNGDLMNQLCNAHTAIFDHTMYETYGATVEAAYMASSGPYYISDYGIGDYLTLTAVEDHWNEDRQAHIETITVKCITNTSTYMNTMMSGESDFVTITNYEYFEILSTYDHVNIMVNSAPAGYKAYWLNSGSTANSAEYLSNVRVREALCMLIDEDELAYAISGDYAVMGENAISAMIPYEDNRVYDPDAALAILAEEGIDPSDIVLEGLCSATNAVAFTNIQAQWMDYGITMNFVSQDGNVTMTAALEEEWDVWSEAGALSVYAMGSACNTLFGQNATYSLVLDDDLHAQVADLVDAAFSTVDNDEKLAYLADICQICDENYLYFGPAADTRWYAVSERIANPSLCCLTGTWRAWDSWIAE